MEETAHTDFSWFPENRSCGSQAGVNAAYAVAQAPQHTHAPHRKNKKKKEKIKSANRTVKPKWMSFQTKSDVERNTPWPQGTSCVTRLPSNKIKHEWVIGAPAFPPTGQRHLEMHIILQDATWIGENMMMNGVGAEAVWDQSRGDSSALSHAIFVSLFD